MGARSILVLSAALVVAPTAAASQDLSPDGVIVYSVFSPETGDSVICVTDPMGSRTALIKSFNEASVSAPTWSSDGERLAFERDDEIYVMDADGSEEFVVASGSQPSWSPDDGRLAFERNGNVMVIDIESRTEEVLATGRNPDWSPDGERIAFDQIPDPGPTDGPEGELRTMNADGSDVQELGHGQEPAWSPDGTKIAYAVHTFFNSDLYVKNMDGSQGRRISEGGYGAPRPALPAWSPDGTQVVYPKGAELWIVDAAESEGHRILARAGPADWGSGPSDPGALWDNSECPIRKPPTLYASLHLRGHLFARGRVWTNDAARCPVDRATVTVWRKMGPGRFRLAGTGRVDSSGSYSTEVKVVRRNRPPAPDRPGRYHARPSTDNPDCAEAIRSGSKVHRH